MPQVASGRVRVQVPMEALLVACLVVGSQAALAIPDPPKSDANLTIVMCDSRFDNPLSYVSKAVAINRLYAQRHGYEFVAFPTNRELCPDEASPKLVACKLKCLEQVMASRASTDRIMFVDSDAVFRNQSVAVDQFLRTYNVTLTSHTWAVFPTDCPPYDLNAGLMIWKNTQVTREFMRLWYNASRGNYWHPYVQRPLKQWMLEKSTLNSTVGEYRIADHIASIPYGPETWHVGSCTRGKYVPAKWITHVTGRWPEIRDATFSQIYDKLTSRGERYVIGTEDGGWDTEHAIHLALCIQGNLSSAILEFNVALKSILLNGPSLSRDMYVWLIVDHLAYDAVGELVERHVQSYDLFNIHIRRINVEDQLHKWTDIIKTNTGRAPATDTYTLGTYYRLFLHLHLPSSVKHVIYMDTDVVLLTGVERLWMEREDTMFQMGSSSCAGFMILNLHMMSAFWNVVQRAISEHPDWEWFEHAHQTLLNNMKKMGHAGNLTDAWDIHLKDGAGKYGDKLPEHVPRAGMLHFNGGGSHHKAYFKDNRWTQRPGWNLVNYYVDVPWSWVRFMVESRVHQTINKPPDPPKPAASNGQQPTANVQRRSTCSAWGCTCIGLSNTYNTWRFHWGSAESNIAAKRWWVAEACQTHPRTRAGRGGKRYQNGDT